jgi:cytochrome c-type biogenesis protein
VLLLAYGSRRLVARPDRLAQITRLGKPAVGALLVLFGMLSITGGDKILESRLLDVMPTWLVDLTTRL